jgi:hypothetical protein
VVRKNDYVVDIMELTFARVFLTRKADDQKKINLKKKWERIKTVFTEFH